MSSYPEEYIHIVVEAQPRTWDGGDSEEDGEFLYDYGSQVVDGIQLTWNDTISSDL